MWLLETDTLRLRDFNPKNIPRYAILSHTWDRDEVSFQDIERQESKTLKGYKKIEQCCALAKLQGYGYVWIDTCCIDKKSSAELSEAINSMYLWYARSDVCLVYLSDFDTDTTGELNNSAVMASFRRSRWFRRGWTLQEMLAPSHVEFYNSKWEYIGDKHELVSQLSLATGISMQFIEDGKSIHKASVAARMSWASNRETTRPEDEAYCLMGIFDVNMPLLYGEGVKAFVRLQHEVARKSDDESLFAWNTEGLQSGIFAPNSLAFAGCRDIQSLKKPNIHRVLPKQASTITNRGLHLEVLPRRIQLSQLHGAANLPEEALQYRCFLLPLNCARAGNEDKPFTIIIRSVSHDQYTRFLPGECMVYEKYFPDDYMERDRQKKENFQHMIFIQDPPEEIYSWIPSRRLTIDRVKPRPLMWQRSSYTLEQWYVSPPGRIMDFTPDEWSLHFQGWSGFAVLRFEDRRHHKPRFVIIFKHAHTKKANRIVTMDIVRDGTAPVRFYVDQFYHQHDLLDIVPDVPAEQTVWTEAGGKISLFRVADGRTVEESPDTSMDYTDHLLSLPEDRDTLRIARPAIISRRHENQVYCQPYGNQVFELEDPRNQVFELEGREIHPI
ncbi:MAG: hypothetical protein LQ348_004314 [Seirophora lacunosa]|nr:MAG: hypothetical protein LQ344_006205 [Seirophora lacunosa]KAI4185799.1 MAG: hypothetical protein LQ348_004314 [Seirophora lacunosa]